MSHVRSHNKVIMKKTLTIFFVLTLLLFALPTSAHQPRIVEEKELIKRYGGEYLKYKKKVPGFFIGGKK